MKRNLRRWGVFAAAAGVPIAAVVVFAAPRAGGTRAGAPAAADGAAREGPAPACPRDAREIVALAPGASGVDAAAGTLRVVAGAAAACVRLDDGRRVAVANVAAGGEQTFRVRAHPTRLARFTVAGRVVLTRLVPGETITVRDSGRTSVGFVLDGARLDPADATRRDAHCARDARGRALACRPGFVLRSGPAPDPLCGAAEGPGEHSRCVRASRVRLVRAGAGNPPADRLLAPCRFRGEGSAFPLANLRRWCEFDHAPGHCGDGGSADECRYPTLDTGRGGTAVLAIGLAERWRITFDGEGRLDGELIDAADAAE